MMKSKGDVHVTPYNTKKGEVCAIKFSTDILSKFNGYSYMKLEFKEDRMYFIPSKDKSGVKINSNGLIQIARKSVVEIVKCFEGLYDLETEPDLKAENFYRNLYYIDFNHRRENKYNTNYDTGTSGNKTNHGGMRAEKMGSKDYDVNVSLADVADSVKECTYYHKNVETVREPENKPYAVAKKKPVNNDSTVLLLNLAIKQLDNYDADLAKSTLITLRELMRG